MVQGVEVRWIQVTWQQAKTGSVRGIWMRRLLMAERRRPGKGARSLAALERNMRGLAKVVTFVALIASTNDASADDWDGCRSNTPDRVIASCTKVIETPGIDPDHLGEALLRRGIGYDNLSQFARAIGDYDEVIRIVPQSNTKYRAIAHSNRAGAYLQLGEPSQGLPDAEKAVQLIPKQPHFWAVRGSINQSLGDRQGAIRDHDAAMALGGARWLKHYQCGLRLARLYLGPLDGVLRSELRAALLACMDKGRSCAPWSTDPECPDPVG
jgi:tetratricopeptide (TPR) repeat protein